VELKDFKAPIGSIVIDGALVIALIWSQASTVATLDALSTRLATAEVTLNHRATLEPRLSVVEVRITAGVDADKKLKEDQMELKADIMKSLDRIEAKLEKVRR
jgi:hypothetical protein